MEWPAHVCLHRPALRARHRNSVAQSQRCRPTLENRPYMIMSNAALVLLSKI